MTIEEKAKAYDEAIEGIQEILGSGQDTIKMSRLELRLQGIFPELKESEDEKTRRELIDYCTKGSCGITSVNTTCNDFQRWLAWLEKQKEQKPAEWSDEDEKHLFSVIQSLEILLEEHRNYIADAIIESDIAWLRTLHPQSTIKD